MNSRIPSSDAPHRPTSGWLIAGAWLLLIAAMAAAFGHNFAEMWGRWFPGWQRTGWSLYDRIVRGESYYTHGPLVPMISLLIAILLIRHTRIKVAPSPRLGFVVLIGSLLLHLMACLARVNFASGFAFIGVLCGLVLVIWGRMALRRLWFPLALLIFMVPLPEVSISNLNFRLKMVAADWGVRLANMVGIIAERSGNWVYLEGGKSLVIANVCNGLRTIISLLAFGTLYTYVCRLRGFWRLLLLAMTIPVALLSNSIRIVSLILVAHIWDAKTATGFFHDFSGVLIFVLAFLLMFGLERVILFLRQAVGRPAKIIPLFDGVVRGEQDEGQWSRMLRRGGRRASWVAILLVVVSVAGAAYLNQSVPPMWDETTAAGVLPRTMEIAGREWSSYDIELDAQTLAVLETSDYLCRTYVSAGMAPVEFSIIFSRDNRKGTHPPDLCLEGAGQDLTTIRDLVVDDVPCRELVVQRGAARSYFIYTYKCGERYTNSFWLQQLTIFANGLARRDTSGALIRVSTPMQGSIEEARDLSVQFLRAAVPHLDKKLQ